jgi:hypothetical protein
MWACPSRSRCATPRRVRFRKSWQVRSQRRRGRVGEAKISLWNFTPRTSGKLSSLPEPSRLLNSCAKRTSHEPSVQLDYVGGTRGYAGMGSVIAVYMVGAGDQRLRPFIGLKGVEVLILEYSDLRHLDTRRQSTIGRNLWRAYRPQMLPCRTEHPAASRSHAEDAPLDVHLHALQHALFGKGHTGEKRWLVKFPSRWTSKVWVNMHVCVLATYGVRPSGKRPPIKVFARGARRNPKSHRDAIAAPRLSQNQSPPLHAGRFKNCRERLIDACNLLGSGAYGRRRSVHAPASRVDVNASGGRA